MTVDQTANFVRGGVTSSVSSSDTTINVEDASIYPDPANGNYNVVIWDFDQYRRPDLDPNVEILRVSGRDTTNNTLTVSRGQEGTSASSHPADSEVHLSATSKIFTDIDTKIDSNLTISGNNGLNGGSAELGGTINVGISGNLSLDSDLKAVDGETIWDESATYIPQGRLQNDSMTIAGNNVSLGGSTAINHTNLSNISSDDHHTKYTDSDAIDAVNGSTLNNGLTLTGRLNMGSDDLYFQPASSGGSVTALTFESNTNAGSDFGYIEYHDDYWGGSEGSALRLRAVNDDGSAGPDSIVMSGAGGAIVDRDALKVQGADIEEVGTDGNTINQTIYDSSNSYIPQGALENDTITVTGGTDISGGSASLGNSLTVSHADTSTQGNVSAGAGEAITDINLDGRGHTTSISTTDFDDRFVWESGDTMTGTLTANGTPAIDVGSDDIQTTNFTITENSSTNSLDFNYTGT